MRRLIFGILLLAFPFLIFNAVYTYAEFNISDNAVGKYKSIPDNIQIGNLGSSHGCAFDYDDYPEYETFNFFLPNQSINYDYHIFKQYHKKFAKDSVLFVLVSYGQVDGIQPPEQYEKIEKRYYRILSGKNIENYSFWKFIKFYFFASAFDVSPVKRIKHCLPEMLHGRGPERHVSDEEFEREISREVIEKTFTSAFPRHGEEGIKYNRDYLMGILEICRENSIHPVIITTPLAWLVNERFDEIAPDFYDTFQKYKSDTLKICSEKGIDTVWLDYSRSEIFAHNYEYFKDGSHLSSKGARVFTKIIMDEIKDLGILK